MHPNPKFHLDDRAAMADFVRQIGFGTLIAQTDAGLRAMHLPALLDGDRLRFHISRRNDAHQALVSCCDALFVANGPHAYVSPDWYGIADMVPTWNYVTVELEGPVEPLPAEALVTLLDDLSAVHEAGLAPKPPWTRARMNPERFETMTGAITGFEMKVLHWRGTAKLSQDKPAQARLGVADALEESGAAEVAALMRASS